MNRFFIPSTAILGDQIEIPTDVQHQISKVLRLKEGSVVGFLDNAGSLFRAEIIYPDGRTPEARVIEKTAAVGEPSVPLTLCIAMTQREKFEWILQKCTEAGVSRFIPLITERTLVRSPKDADGKYERWNKILKEAAEQCGRALIPELLPVMSFSDAIRATEADLKLFFWEEEHTHTLKQRIDPQRGKIHSTAMMIGPEGGFPETEMAAACAAGWQTATLGERIYRVETAAMAAAMLTLYELGHE